MANKESKSDSFKRFKYGFVRMTPMMVSHTVDRFMDLEKFKAFTISAIENEKESFKNWFEKETKDMSEEQINDFFDWYGDDYYIVDDVFRKINLYSFIITLYSYIEQGLNTVCRAKYTDRRTEQKKANLKAEDEGRKPEFKNLLAVTLKDFGGKGIYKARRYLEKVFAVSFDSVKEEWDEINGLAKMRNAIVHNNGFDTGYIEKDAKIKQHIRDGRLEITAHSEDSYGHIVIKTEYLDAIIPIAKNFFNKLEVRR